MPERASEAAEGRTEWEAKAAEFYEATLGLSPLGDDGTSHVRIYPCGSGSFLQVYASEHAGTATATVASWSTWFKDPDGNTIAIDNGGAPS